jgi:hypothetical protein
MKPANAPSSGAPTAPDALNLRSSESQTRFSRARSSSTGAPAPPAASGSSQHAGWGRCEEDAMPEAPEAPLSRASASSEEPRTGVVRVMGRREGQSGARAVERAPAALPASEQRPERPRRERSKSSASEWRCLEAWSQPTKERRMRRSSKVTIVQLSRNGDLIRQNGPDAWLPEAGDFMQRMSRLLAQGLGFESCRSLCLRGASSVLTVTEAGDTKVVAVSGPTGSMGNVLRRAGLE